MFSEKARLNFAFYVYMKKARKIRREKLQPFWFQWKLPNVYNFHLLNIFGCVLKSTSLLLYCWGKHFQKIKENMQKWVTTSYSKLVGVSMNIWSLQYVSIPSKTSTMTFCPGLLWLLSHSSPWKAGDPASIPPKNKIKMSIDLMDLFTSTSRAYSHFYRNIDQHFDQLSGFFDQSANLLD